MDHLFWLAFKIELHSCIKCLAIIQKSLIEVPNFPYLSGQCEPNGKARDWIDMHSGVNQ